MVVLEGGRRPTGTSDPPAATVLLAVKAPHGANKADCVFLFDWRPLAEQVRACCVEFGVAYDDDDYFVFTQGLTPRAPVVRSEAQLLNLPSETQLGLRRASDLAEERLAALRGAVPAEVPGRLRGLLAAVYAEPWVADEVMERDGIRVVLRAILFCSAARAGEDTVDLGMACLCEFFQYSKGMVWLEEHQQEEITPALFQQIFQTLFPSRGADGETQRGIWTPPRATLAACLFFLHTLPSSADAAHLAGTGIARSTPPIEPSYPRLVGALDADAGDDFLNSAALSVLTAMSGRASEDLRLQMQQEAVGVVASHGDSTDVEEIFKQNGSRFDHMIEQLNNTSMAACSELAALRGFEAISDCRGVGGQGNVDLLQEENSQLERRLQYFQGVNEMMKGELRLQHQTMCKMVSFMKVESSQLVEQSMDGIVRS